MKSNKFSFEDYPESYKRYLEAEMQDLQTHLQQGNSCLEIGCGNGRLIQPLSLRGITYTGIEINRDSALEALRIARHYNQHVEKGDFMSEEMNSLLKQRFDWSLLCWNTLGCMQTNEEDVFEKMLQYSNTAYISCLEKEHSKERIAWYEALKIPFELDKENEIFRTQDWGESKAYDSNELQAIAEKNNWTYAYRKLSDIGFRIILSKDF